jgi:hypothetical protein
LSFLDLLLNFDLLLPIMVNKLSYGLVWAHMF